MSNVSREWLHTSSGNQSEYIAQITERSKYGPDTPPTIIRPDEAGAPWEQGAYSSIAWFRDTAPYDIRDYQGLVGLRQSSAFPRHSTIPQISDPSSLSIWLLAYLLKPEIISASSGTYYLSKIRQEDAQYPPKIIDLIGGTEEDLSILAQNNGLYIPMNIRLDAALNPTVLKNFFYSSLYWMRKFRSERIRLDQLFTNATVNDLYLITANPFERYPARKFLSYYDDFELYPRFGQVGNYRFPKQYTSKRQQLDGLVALTLSQHGYFTVDSWSRPIQVTFNLPRVPLPEPHQIDRTSMSLDQAIRSELYRPLLRLYIQVESSWPFVSDQDSWLPLLNFVGQNVQLFKTQENYLNSGPPIELILPKEFESLEQPYSICLLCRNVRSQGDFGLCGHGVCLICQSSLKSAKCPFCPEHFVADNISDEFINSLQLPITNIRLTDRITEINHQRINRSFSFDWANDNVRLFRF